MRDCSRRAPQTVMIAQARSMLDDDECIEVYSALHGLEHGSPGIHTENDLSQEFRITRRQSEDHS